MVVLWSFLPRPTKCRRPLIGSKWFRGTEAGGVPAAGCEAVGCAASSLTSWSHWSLSRLRAREGLRCVDSASYVLRQLARCVWGTPCERIERSAVLRSASNRLHRIEGRNGGSITTSERSRVLADLGICRAERSSSGGRRSMMRSLRGRGRSFVAAGFRSRHKRPNCQC